LSNILSEPQNTILIFQRVNDRRERTTDIPNRFRFTRSCSNATIGVETQRD
jgi:hypothetical protein